MKITHRVAPAVVRVSGRVDFAATDDFAAALAGAAIVDLTDVTWLCGAACAELVWAHQVSGGRLRVMLPPRAVVEDHAALRPLTTVEAVGKAHLPHQLYRTVDRAVPAAAERPAVGVG